MKTVVTGGAGFIGSNLVRRLAAEDADVVIVDDLSRGSRRNLRGLEAGLDIKTIDLKDYNKTLSALEGADTVYHLAARIGSLEYLHGSRLAELEALETNLVIDANVFRACRESNVSRLVYASSVAVYPMTIQANTGVVFSETDISVTEESRQAYFPDGGYGWAKLMGEVELAWMDGLKIGIARIFNIYGPNHDLLLARHVIPDLITKAIGYPDNDFIVWGDGTQTRDFLFVDDCVEALLSLAHKAGNPPVTINIGSGSSTTIAELAETIVRVSGKEMPVVYDTSKPVGPVSRTADISLADKLLGWQPKTRLEEGIRLTYEWLERQKEA